MWWHPERFRRLFEQDDPEELGIRAALALMLVFVGISMLFKRRSQVEDDSEQPTSKPQMGIFVKPLLILNALALLLSIAVATVCVSVLVTVGQGPGHGSIAVIAIPYWTLGFLIILIPLFVCTLIQIYVGRKTLSLGVRIRLFTFILGALILDLIPLVMFLMEFGFFPYYL